MFSKKFFKLPLFLLVACGLYASSSFAIDTPRELRGTEIRQGGVKWEWEGVPGAVNYQVTINGSVKPLTSTPVYFDDGLWPGDYAMYVRAIDGAGNYSTRTSTAKITTSWNFQHGNHGRSFLVGDMPQQSAAAAQSTPSGSSSGGSPEIPYGLRHEELAGRDVKWSWTSVGAPKYEVTIDGNVIETTTATEWVSKALWVGEHSLTVKSIDSSGRKSEQSETLKILVTGNVQGNNSSASADQPANVPAPPPPQAQQQQVQQLPPEILRSSDNKLVDPASYQYADVLNKAGYSLVFSDEFNDYSLNPDRWHSQLRWDGEFNGERYEYRVINNEDQFYVSLLSPDVEHQQKVVPVYNPFKFDGKRLAIQAIRNPLKNREKTRSHGKLDDIVHQQEFLSGAISTHEKFSRKYGYFEASIKIPDHVGTFPAFWLFHSRRAWEGTQRTEIDIMENLGHAPHYIYNSFHYFNNVTRYYGGDANFVKPKPNGQIFTGIDYSQDFHTYAVEWEPGKVTWFIDGVQTSELSRGEVDFEELYLMINLAMGGNWTNFPENAGGLGRPGDQRFPNWQDLNEFQNPMLEIDYVRVYERR